MDKKALEKELERRMAQINRWVEHDLPRQVGVMAVNHFKRNFELEGFQNGSLSKWKEVKRRDPSSPWYGFLYKGENRKKVPYKLTKKGKRIKGQRKLNFSQAATQWKILHNSGDLADSLRYEPGPACVTITSDKPYAAVQNNGGMIKVFGKRSVKLPARPFVGESKELNEQIDRLIDNKINELFNS